MTRVGEVDDPFAANLRDWAQATEWGSTSRMNELETLMWRSERHPRTSSTICNLMILDAVPDWKRLHAAHDWAAKLIPRLRQHVVEPALPIGTPAWAIDEAFDIDYHVRRAHLPDPGGMPELLTLAQNNAMAPLDRTRPLWEAILIEGLPEGKSAYFLKLHHSLTDGLGGVQLLSLLQSRTREHTPKDPVSETSGSGEPNDSAVLALQELAEGAQHMPSVVGGLIATCAKVIVNPFGAAASGVRFAASARRMLPPPPAPGSPLLAQRYGKVWRFGVLECQLSGLKAAAKAAGGSVNDAYIAALLGGMRRYHERYDVSLLEMPMAMPMSIRKADDPMGGNRFAGALFAAPIGITDPAKRIAAIREIVISLRAEPALGSLEVIMPLLNRFPSGIGAMALRVGAAADFSASNVPGIPHPVYLAGAQVERSYPFGPLPGVALMAAMVSHAGTCCLGLNMDGTAVADPGLLVHCIQEGLDEVLALGV